MGRPACLTHKNKRRYRKNNSWGLRCDECVLDSRKFGAILRGTAFSQPLPAPPERQERWSRFVRNLPDAIWAIRRIEGFDGRTHDWKTLGDSTLYRAVEPLRPA